MKSGRLTVGAMIALAVLSGGCEVNYPEFFPLARYSPKYLGVGDATAPLTAPQAVLDRIGQELYDRFGTPRELGGATINAFDRQHLRQGRDLYQRHCLHCHGLTGGGNGPTGPYLMPQPRDFRRGIFKWKSTRREAKPTRDDLHQVLLIGAPGTSMPSFKLLSDIDRERLVDYVIFLSQRGETEYRLWNIVANELSENSTDEEAGALAETLAAEAPGLHSEVLATWQSAQDAVVVAPTEPRFPEPGTAEYEKLLARGRDLYLSPTAACVNCHGRDGIANPDNIAPTEKAQMVDAWGHVNYPRNLRLGLFRGGPRPVDLYRRINQGIAGAAMPAGGQLTADDTWALVAFLRALPYRQDLLTSTPAAKPMSTAGSKIVDAAPTPGPTQEAASP